MGEESSEPAERPAPNGEAKPRIELPASGLADEILAMVARASHGETEPEAEPERAETWVAFALAGRSFAVPATAVREVVRVESLTRIPHAPATIRGLATVRGKPVVVIDLGLRLGIRRRPADLAPASRILTLEGRGRSVGLLVDSIGQVLGVLPSQVRKARGEEQGGADEVEGARGLYDAGSETTVLLDSKDLVSAPETGPEEG